MAKLEFKTTDNEDLWTRVVIDTDEDPENLITIWQKVSGQESKCVELSRCDLSRIKDALSAIQEFAQEQEAA